MEIIKQEWLDAAKKASACEIRLNEYRAGTPISVPTFSDAIWIIDNLPEIKLRLPIIWYLHGVGYGYGIGYGVGYGGGYGDGYGVGCGNNPIKFE